MKDTFSKLSWVKKLIDSPTKIIVLVGILAIVGFGYWKYGPTKTTAPQYQTSVVEKGTLISSVTASGTISSSNNVSITSQASGVVSAVYVKNGDSVTQGEKLAEMTLDQSSIQKQAAAWAGYLSAISSEKNAEQSKTSADSAMWQAQQAILTSQNTVDLKNAGDNNPSTKQAYTDLEKQSIDSNLVQARKAFDAAEQKYKDADTAVVAAKAQLSSSWLSYQQLSNIITAPISGTVSNLSVTEGSVLAETTSSSSNSNSSTTNTLGTITLPKGSLQAAVNLSEIDAPKVKAGQKVTMTLDAFPDKTFTGHISSVNTNGTVSSGVTTYPAVITFDLNDDSIYPNMGVNSKIILNTKTDVLLIPSAAIQTMNGQSTVRVLRNNQPTPVPVQLGDSNDTQTEIISGLNEGDVVITGVTSNSAPTTSGQTSVFGGRNRGFGGFGGGGGAVRIQR